MPAGNGLSSVLRSCCRWFPSLVLWPDLDPSPVAGGLALCLVYTKLLRGFPLTAKFSPSSLAGLPGVPARGAASLAVLSPHSPLPTPTRQQTGTSFGQLLGSQHAFPTLVPSPMLSFPRRISSHFSSQARTSSSFKAKLRPHFREGLGPRYCAPLAPGVDTTQLLEATGNVVRRLQEGPPGSACLGSSPDPAIYQPSDFGQVIQSPWALAYLPRKWG